MKKILIVLLTMVLLLGGCGKNGASSPQSPSDESVADQQKPSSSETEISSEDHAIPGSYTVPEGWEKSEKHSTDSQIFYIVPSGNLKIVKKLRIFSSYVGTISSKNIVWIFQKGAVWNSSSSRQKFAPDCLMRSIMPNAALPYARKSSTKRTLSFGVRKSALITTS